MASVLVGRGSCADAAVPSYSAFLGIWKSPVASGQPARTVRWEARGSGIAFVAIDEVDASGNAHPLENFAFRLDDKDYPYGVRGGSLTSTIASRFVSLYAIEITYKIDGEFTRRAPWRVSTDGRTLTMARADGSTWYFGREGTAPHQSAEHPFKTGYKRYIGVWQAIQTRDGANTGSVVWEDRGDNFVVATVRDQLGRVTMRYSLQYDGKEYPCLTAGSKGGLGTIRSEFTDEYTTDWTLSSDGQAYNSGSRIVTPDAHTMTVPVGTRAVTGRDLVWRRIADAPTDGILRR
jgi:hypothetical protein